MYWPPRNGLRTMRPVRRISSYCGYGSALIAGSKTLNANSGASATELRDHFLAEQAQAVADVVVRHPPDLHDADELVDAEIGVPLHTVGDLVGRTDQRQPVVEPLFDRLGLEQRRVLGE